MLVSARLSGPRVALARGVRKTARCLGRHLADGRGGSVHLALAADRGAWSN